MMYESEKADQQKNFTNTKIKKIGTRLSMRRIDVVGYKPNEIEIIENNMLRRFKMSRSAPDISTAIQRDSSSSFTSNNFITRREIRS